MQSARRRRTGNHAALKGVTLYATGLPAAGSRAGLPIQEATIDKKNAFGTDWLREAWRRIRSHTLLKALVTPGFMVVFFVAYFWLLKHPLFSVTVMPVTALDRWVGFQPWALWLYASLWIYVSLPPAFLYDKRQLISYLWAAIGLSVAAMLIFLFWPTATPRPDIDWALYPAFDFLKSVDRTRNACPSLHVAFAVFSAFWLNRLLREMGARAVVRGFNVLWCLAIVYSTLATRQHVAIDLYAGAVLGAAAFAVHLKFFPRAVSDALLPAQKAGRFGRVPETHSPAESSKL